MKLVWAEGAIADLVHIRNYISEHNPQAANEIAARLLEIAELLPTHPQMGCGLRSRMQGVSLCRNRFIR